ncbi:hypothetical protein C0J52_20984, partial [Blattella germanica]
LSSVGYLTAPLLSIGFQPSHGPRLFLSRFYYCRIRAAKVIYPLIFSGISKCIQCLDMFLYIILLTFCLTGHVAYVELTGECHVGVQGDICPHGDVNTSDDGAAKFNHAVHKYTERSAKFNIDGKFAFGA